MRLITKLGLIGVGAFWLAMPIPIGTIVIEAVHSWISGKVQAADILAWQQVTQSKRWLNKNPLIRKDSGTDSKTAT